MSRSDEPPDTSAADDRWGRIESVTDATLAHLNVEDLLAELLERVRGLFEVDTAVVLLLDASARDLIATAASGIEAEVRQGVHIPVGEGFAGRIAADKKPVILEQIDHTTVVNPILRQRGIRALLGVPLLSSGRVIGVLHVGTLGARRFTHQDVKLLEVVADRIASTIQTRRADVEQTAARVLQRSLLPARLPVVPGLEMAARYVPAQRGEVGGDWYDVFALPSGGFCIVIGDVVGRGLAAAHIMAQLRSALRAHALFGSDPAEVLGRLDQQVQHFDRQKMMATVQLAMFKPVAERLYISSAGHPPPVLALPGQPAALVDVSSDAPVGVRSRPRHVTTLTVPPGAVLCFYTDGLVERRDSSLDIGLQRLCEAVVPGPVESVCTSVMGQLIGDTPADDDVALLAMRRHTSAGHGSGEIGPLDLVIPAQPWSLKTIRDAMRRWLSAVGAGPRVIADLLIAVGEACTNAVEHAYGPQRGMVSVYLELQPPDVVATVEDTGRWRRPRDEHRGRGTLLMRSCADEVRIDPHAMGTKVVIRRRLARAAAR
ncbi:MAG: SpoIIE family protein phosphatase [Pseudonocardiales bacterium]|nr:SpoIIE family protein phosphatase [Pseudonocardiales bacterium]